MDEIRFIDLFSGIGKPYLLVEPFYGIEWLNYIPRFARSVRKSFLESIAREHVRVNVGQHYGYGRGPIQDPWFSTLKRRS